MDSLKVMKVVEILYLIIMFILRLVDGEVDGLVCKIILENKNVKEIVIVIYIDERVYLKISIIDIGKKIYHNLKVRI